ncbi:MAG: hypothetical protein DHS20C19_23390 [Acidimicrobiales bacterium]|nr:MAG: hypothetical protein DHS20C19_23390 [Acidimicrobiales bacterium]
MLGPLIPDGPLHPEDALLALVVGLVVGAAFRHRSLPWITGVVGAAWLFLRWRYGALLTDAVAARDRPLGIVALILAPVGLLAWSRLRPRSVAVLTIGALAGVWAVVPDTEAPLIAGALLVGATAAASLGRAELPAHRFAGGLVLLPLGAALVGSAGRPERFGPAVMVSLLGAALVASVVRFGRVLRQRAGTPTTVAPGATSSTTTAPAPTIAP